MLIYRQPIGSMAYLGGTQMLLEPFSWSFLQCAIYSQEFSCLPGQYIHVTRSTSSDRSAARNSLYRSMLGEWLWMSDSDHQFEPDILARMLAVFEQLKPNGERIDVLTAVYRYKVPPYIPVLYHYDPPTGKHCHIAELDWSQPLRRIDCAGAGCIMIRRCAMDRVASELHESPFDETDPLSEDFSWFARLRKLGIKAYVAPQIHSHHLIVKPITEEDYQPEECWPTVPLPEGGLALVGGLK
jgi:Glycosyl transferase family 2